MYVPPIGSSAAFLHAPPHLHIVELVFARRGIAEGYQGGWVGANPPRRPMPHMFLPLLFFPDDYVRVPEQSTFIRLSELISACFLMSFIFTVFELCFLISLLFPIFSIVPYNVLSFLQTSKTNSEGLLTFPTHRAS